MTAIYDDLSEPFGELETLLDERNGNGIQDGPEEKSQEEGSSERSAE